MSPQYTVKMLIGAALICAVWVEPSIAQNRARNNKQRNMRENSGLKVGQLAPTFKLKALDGKESFDLKSRRGKKPVLLFFGSYT